MELNTLPGLVPPDDAPNAQYRYTWRPKETLCICVAALDLPEILISAKWWLGTANGREFNNLKCGDLTDLVRTESAHTRLYELYLEWGCPTLPRGTYELRTKIQTGEGMEQTIYFITVVNDPETHNMKDYNSAYDSFSGHGH